MHLASSTVKQSIHNQSPLTVTWMYLIKIGITTLVGVEGQEQEQQQQQQQQREEEEEEQQQQQPQILKGDRNKWHRSRMWQIGLEILLGGPTQPINNHDGYQITILYTKLSDNHLWIWILNYLWIPNNFIQLFVIIIFFRLMYLFFLAVPSIISHSFCFNSHVLRIFVHLQLNPHRAATSLSVGTATQKNASKVRKASKYRENIIYTIYVSIFLSLFGL